MKLSFVKSFIATIFPSIVFNLIGYLLANPYLDLLNITYEENNTIAIYRIPFALLTYSIVFIFIVLSDISEIGGVLHLYRRFTASSVSFNICFTSSLLLDNLSNNVTLIDSINKADLVMVSIGSNDFLSRYF